MRVDMSPRAISTRLRRVAQLRRLCLSLGKAKPAPPERGQRES
ncbi:MAG: hypothetical protein ACYTDY_05795 [Planctomycetota bacterium]|jgi:hypothetical protein